MEITALYRASVYDVAETCFLRKCSELKATFNVEIWQRGIVHCPGINVFCSVKRHRVQAVLYKAWTPSVMLLKLASILKFSHQESANCPTAKKRLYNFFGLAVKAPEGLLQKTKFIPVVKDRSR